MAGLYGKMSTAILRYPSGRFGLCGSVPVALAYVDETRKPRTWATEEEVVGALLAIGVTTFQRADCSWYAPEDTV